MIGGNGKANANRYQLFKVEFFERVCFQWRNEDRHMQAPVADAGNVLFHGPVVQLHVDVRQCLLIDAKKAGHYFSGHQGPITHVQFARGLAGE